MAREGTGDSARRPIVLLIVGVGLAVITLLLFASKHTREHTHDEANVTNSEERVGAPTHESPLMGTQRRRTDWAPLVGVPESPTARGKKLIQELSEIDTRPGFVTPGVVERWNETFLELLGLGAEALPSVAETLAAQWDVRFDSGSETNLLGYPSLRIALLRLLADVPEAKSLEIQAQVLQSSRDPVEIALVARQLELQEPGLYRAEIQERARAALERITRGEWRGDPQPLVDTLSTYATPALTNGVPATSPEPENNLQ